MMIFVQSKDRKFAIPDSRIFQIVQWQKDITISYKSGDITWLNDSIAQEKLETVICHFESEEDAEECMRNFFRVCEQGRNAFFFGKSENGFNWKGDKKNAKAT